MSVVPRVSIGLPVLNGERYLPEALDAILAQSFSDFELIISDNASTDATAIICQDYAKRDPRIRYYRNRENVGAAKNFNMVFGHSRGEYFKWAAHDDRIAPSFLSECVEVLARDTSAVLSYSRIKLIDSGGEIIASHDVSYTDTASVVPYHRFAEVVLIEPHLCYEIFGLIRAEILRRTPLIGGYIASDRVLLAELSLYGRFREVPDYLFFSRDHPERSMRAMPFHFRAAWFDPANRERLVFPHMRFYREYWGCVNRAPLSISDRTLCYLQLLRWPWVNMNWARMITDLVAVAAPSTVPAMLRLSKRLVTTTE
jgi:glycosyltransferase involved in cell wall biosynthesis